MTKAFVTLGRWISFIFDFFYPPFRKFMPLQLYRYAACGASNVAFDLLVYFGFYNFVLHHQMLHLGFVTLSSHIAALVFTFPITVTTGFLLQKYVTFTSSNMSGRTQLIRYLMVVFANLALNYVGLKLLVDGLKFFPTPAKMIITVFAAAFSYVSQHKFTFKQVSKQPKDKWREN
jgi:putative flippase GtrA